MNNSRDIGRTSAEGSQSGDADLPGLAAHRQESARVTFRRPWRWAVAGLLGAAALLALCFVIADVGPGRLASGAAAAAACILMVRAARAGIVAEPGQLVVRNTWWSHKVGWPQIARFEMPPSYGSLRKTGIQIYLRDGRVIPARAFAYMGIDQYVDVTTRPAQRAVEELSRLHAERQGRRAT